MAQAAALKTIEILIRDNVPENARRMGEFLTKGLKEIQKKTNGAEIEGTAV